MWQHSIPVARLLILALLLVAGGRPNGGNGGQPGNGSNSGDNGNGSGDALPDLAAQPARAAPAVPVQPADATLLNEVRFMPGDNAPPFVDPRVGQGGAELSKLSLKSEAGATVALPAGSPVADAGSLPLIYFDGTDSAAGLVIHSSRTDILDPNSAFNTSRPATGLELPPITELARARGPLSY